MKGMLKVLIVVGALSAFATFAAERHIWAQEKAGEAKNSALLKAQKSRGEGKDENIKTKSEINDPNEDVQAPPEKGGEKTRGATTCKVNFDNRTRWKIQVYINGSYQGLLGPFGDASEWYWGKTGAVYGRADFNDGSYLYWGPQRITCVESRFHCTFH